MTSDPEQISHYRIESCLGQGGMGVVYLAEDLLLRRRVALKFLSPSLSQDADARRRFLNEGRAAATLGHPNAAVLYEVGTEGDDLFLAMEYVPGVTLKEYGAEGPLPWVEAVDIALGVLAALREAHAKGIVHRDIKPQNIRRTPDGRIKVLDFGLAKVLGGSTITRDGSIMGTAAYMSPQQVVAEDVDGRTDLYSLGVVLYELLTGRAPFTGDQEVAVAHAILHEDPITIRELNPEVPAELEHIVFKAMMKRLASRYQTAEEMAEDLARFREHDRRRRAGIHEELDLIATQEVFDVRRERFLAPLVGRDAEIQKIRGFLREARSGEGMAVCVAGEAGVGKTRLLQELQQACRREGARVIVSPCLFGGTTSSYFPFAEAFRHYFSLRGVTSAAALQTFLFDRAPRLGGSLPVLNRFLRFTFASNGPTSEEELWEVLDQLVAFIAEERPLVLMIEDLQWGDDASIRLFHFLAQRVARRRLLLVGSYRPEEIQSEPGARPHPLPALLRMLGREERFERIEISRLRREHVKEILDRLYPEHGWSEDFPGLLYRETEGNPFFMVEILKLLAGEKVLEQRDGRWTLHTTVDRISIPEKVFDVVMQRLGRLGPREREILELGAVEGDVFHSGTILRGLRIERMALLKTLQFLEQVHHLIHAAGPQYHFDHSKIREILYESIPPELRIEYHTVVGQFLRESFGESEEYAGIIAHNLLSAGLRDEAIPFLRRAAAAASRLFSHSDAIHYLDQAERVLHELYPQRPPVERVRELCEIRERRGDEEYASGHYRESLASYELALSLDAATGDPVRAASLTKAVGRIQYLLGRTAESQRSYDKAIADYTGIEERARAEGDTERLAAACRELGKLHFFRGDLDRARRYIDETIALADRLDSPRMKSAALNNLAGIHYQRGALEEALSAHRASLEIRRTTRNPGEMAQTHKNLGITHYRLGELSDAESHLDEALGLYRKTADRRGEAVTLRHLGNVYYERGDHVGAQRHWEASLSLCRELGNHEDLCRCLNNLGVLHFERGHYASAHRLYQDALEASAAVGSKEPVVPVYVNLAELHLSLDQLARAEENLDRAEELARAMEMTPALSEIHALRGMLLAERGSLDRARAEVERASESAEPTGHVENLVRALLAQATVCIASGEHGDARRLARQARDLARWSRMLHFELRAALVVASACWKDGDRWEAARELRDLVPRAEEGGFRPLAARGRDLLGTILWDAGDAQGAACEFIRAADQMKEIIATLSEDDLRSFVHHPEWKAAIGNLLDTLMRLGRRDEALAYLGPLGVGSCDLGSPRATPAAPALLARLAMIALLSLPVLTGCSGRDAAVPAVSSRGAAEARGASPSAKVSIAPARPAEGEETSFHTFLEAEREAQVAAETDGEIVSVRVREGQRVAAGDTLLIIDDRDERLALQRDTAERAWSRSQVERMRRLSAQGHVSAQEVEQAALQLDKAEAAVGLSQVALSRCAVRAPIAGLVWMVRAEPHHRVAIGQPLLRVTDPNRLRASAYLPASLRGRVRPGSPVRLEPARGGAPIEARVGRVDPITDPASGTFKAVAVFRRLPSHPEAGSEVRFVVPGRSEEHSLVVPIQTLLEAEGDSTWLWACDGVRVQRCRVRLGPMRRDGFEVVSGLPSGARVVTGSDRPLQDGAVVEVVEAR